jgi:hypothetical protein
MPLETYETFDKKSRHFYHEKINSVEEFDNFYEKLKNDRKNIYRGVNNASYKLYNSLQRHFIENNLDSCFDDFNDFVENDIEKAKKWNNNILIKSYSSLGHNTVYDLSILSFLQHSKSPTPLLDWSYNFDISLFFSCEHNLNKSENEIENYCSLYIFSLMDNHEISNLSNAYNSINDNFIRAKNSNPQVDETQLQDKIDTHSYSLIKELDISYISDELSSNVKFPLYTNANLNILNQEGLFIYTNSPTQPLEKILNGAGKYFISIHVTRYVTKIRCIDINKNLIKDILKKLEIKGITNDYIYPKPESIKKFLLDNN